MRWSVIAGLLLSALIATIPVVSAELMSLTYDANGNLISGDEKFRVYNDFNQLVEVYNGSDSSGNILERYEWDPVQERILIKDVFEAGSIKETVHYINDNFYQVENTSGIFNFTKVMHDGVLVAENTPQGKKFYSADSLGSSSLTTDAGGVPIENVTYDPYGRIISGGERTRFDYEDREYSSVVGDYDFRFRKYDPNLKIFTQPDTLIQNVYDPQMLNRYAFERNNPYRYNDPDGHIAFLAAIAPVLIGTLVGASVGVLIELGAQVIITGEVYSWQRVGDAALGGAVGGALLSAAPIVAASAGGIAFATDIITTGFGAFGAIASAYEYKAQRDMRLLQNSQIDMPGLTTQPTQPTLPQQSNLAGQVSSNAQAAGASSGSTSSDLAKSINTHYVQYGSKSVAYVNRHTGELSIDKGRLTRAKILEKAAKKNQGTKK